jgi:hypothetical protein
VTERQTEADRDKESETDKPKWPKRE